VESIISACPILAKVQYIQRHDAVCAQMHCNLWKKIGGKIIEQTGLWPCTEISKNTT